MLPCVDVFFFFLVIPVVKCHCVYHPGGLTFDFEVGGGRGGSEDPVGRDTGVVPCVFGHQVRDEERTVHQDLHPRLQRSEGERRTISRCYPNPFYNNVRRRWQWLTTIAVAFRNRFCLPMR